MNTFAKAYLMVNRHYKRILKAKITARDKRLGMVKLLQDISWMRGLMTGITEMSDTEKRYILQRFWKIEYDIEQTLINNEVDL